METRPRVTACASLLWLSLYILWAPPFLSASAQSGRDLPPLAPTATPNTSPAAPKRSANFIEAGSETYRFVFRTGADRNSFLEQLNEAGEHGYRLKSAIYGWQRASTGYYSIPVGILKLDETQYEYAWFETTSNFFFAISGFEEKYAEMSKRGFRLVDQLLIGGGCEYIDPDNSAMGQDCEWNHLFLLEREKGVERPRQFILASIYPGRFSNDGAKALTALINEKLPDGYHPTNVFSKYQILLSQIAKSDELSPVNPDVKVVASSFRNDGTKKVNELAKQGYRLALIRNETAVMYRSGDTVTPTTYVWLKAGDKRFEQQLAALQESGAVYRMIDRDSDAREYQLVFEQGAADNGARREYKVLQFEVQIVEQPLKLRNGAENNVRIDLAASSKEAMTEFNRLIKEGFVVRDLFVPNNVWKRISVLLERSQ